DLLRLSTANGRGRKGSRYSKVPVVGLCHDSRRKLRRFPFPGRDFNVEKASPGAETVINGQRNRLRSAGWAVIVNRTSRGEHLSPAMRRAGMIGGLGPESTIDYYRSILARYRELRPNQGNPHVFMNSLDVDRGIAMLDAGRLDDLANYLAAGLRALERAG